MAWNSERFDRIFSELESDSGTLESSNSLQDKGLSSATESSLYDDNWSTGFSKKTSKFLSDDWGSDSTTAAPSGDSKSSDIDTWSSGFSEKTSKFLSDDWGSEATAEKEASAEPERAARDTWSSGFSEKTSKFLSDDWGSDASKDLTEDKASRWDTTGEIKTLADRVEEEPVEKEPQKTTRGHKRDTAERKKKPSKSRARSSASLSTGTDSTDWPDDNGGVFHSEDEESLIGKTGTVVFSKESRSSRSGSTSTALFAQEDETSRTGKTSTALFAQEDKSSRSGKSSTATFAQEDKSSRSGKSSTATFAQEDKSSRSGKSSTATFAQEDKSSRTSQTGTALFAQEDKSSRSGSTSTALFAQEDKSSRSGSTSTALFAHEDKSSRSSQTGTALFAQEDASSRSGKTRTTTFAQEDASSRSGKTRTATFAQEDKSSRSGKSTTATWGSQGSADWGSSSGSANWGSSSGSADWGSSSGSANWGSSSGSADWGSQAGGLVTSYSTKPKSNRQTEPKSPAKPQNDYISGYSDGGIEITGSSDDEPMYQISSDDDWESVNALDDWLNSESYRASVNSIQPVEREMKPTRTKPHTQLYSDENVSASIAKLSFFNAVVWCVLLFFGFILLVSGHFFISVIVVVACYFISKKIRSSRTKVMKDTIVFDQLKKYFNARTYQADEDILTYAKDLYPFAMRDNTWDGGILSDYFAGTYNGNPIKLYDVKLKKTVQNEKKDVFAGQLISFQMPTFVRTEFIIKPRLYGRPQQDELKALRVLGFYPERDITLINKFNIELHEEMASDVIGGISLVNSKIIPAFYSSLERIQTKYRAKCYLHVKGRMMYLTLSRYYDPFEYSSFDVLNGISTMRDRVAKEAQEFFNILADITGVVTAASKKTK
ncbi:MAG: hypothetical protein IJU23_04670 [Proteobacteria bacterium]|nr:hypothetical protein [Pseudomonadota bacterium]